MDPIMNLAVGGVVGLLIAAAIGLYHFFRRWGE